MQILFGHNFVDMVWVDLGCGSESVDVRLTWSYFVRNLCSFGCKFYNSSWLYDCFLAPLFIYIHYLFMLPHAPELAGLVAVR